MTKQEAIKLIDDRMCFGRGKWSEHHMPEIDDYWKAGKMAIKALEQPERKTGKWIVGAYDTVRGYWATCSSCGHTSFGGGKFCPNCGVDMRGEQDETD